ncbi:hypothetical protein JL722_5908 [Aureococcus anophagefferens]|nr:hypothetical protein JL722_5908 [Aureococcus anophagefferens]
MYKRLRKEAAEARRSTDPDLLLCPSEDNLMDWRAWVRGPEGTPFERGVFELEIKACGQYPRRPPSAWSRPSSTRTSTASPARSASTSSSRSGARPGPSRPRARRSALSAPNRTARSTAAGNVMRAGDMDGFRATARQCVEDHARGGMPSRDALGDLAAPGKAAAPRGRCSTWTAILVVLVPVLWALSAI